MEISKGTKETFPEFEININPKTALSKGTYTCAINVQHNKTDAKGENFQSEEWLGNGSQSIVLPSMTFLLAIAAAAMSCVSRF